MKTHMETKLTFEHRQELVARAQQARAQAVAAAFAALGGRLRRAWSGLRTRTQLRALSDRTLRDIGLSRNEIESLYR
jgi:uncharacterized protein YjiS (DUF1127 family)